MDFEAPSRGDPRHRRSARLRDAASCCCRIFGSEPIVEGEIKIDGQPVKPDGPRSMMSAGVALLTEDRKVLGLLPELSIRENVTIASLRVGVAERPAAREGTGGGGRHSCWTACACAPGPTTSRCPPCPAATSRRCCWPAGC